LTKELDPSLEKVKAKCERRESIELVETRAEANMKLIFLKSKDAKIKKNYNL
jgi:hypothetical protein